MGRAFAQRFAEEGMRVVAADVQADALDRAVAELTADGHEVLGVRTDVADPAAVRDLAARTVDAFGKVHVICNNAGVEGYLDGAIWEATDRDWAWTVGVNFWSVVYGVRTFLPLILSHGEPGHVVNTASMTAVTRPANMYGITKHAVLALTETLYADLRARGLPVGATALCPGIIATNLFLGSRNRPSELRNETELPGAVAGREKRDLMHARLAEGMSPAEVADQLVAAIRADRLYALTDADWDDRIRQRAGDILDRANPLLDGVPPAAQVAEGTSPTGGSPTDGLPTGNSPTGNGKAS
ncbi:acetoin dehydrogenase [Plantactinospora endophytica]|uniref:Acetoin dehydrogenase n=2 Tax=Plantactinospora endophytica TaxID=673535 RepID=A0ABQ4EA40_9ACTN|nr:acetoin dehydrogenase [Plantactinospora endophytica]